MKNSILSHLIQQQHVLIDAQISQLSQSRGCGMTPAQRTIFSVASQQAVTLSELAQHLAISRQAVQKTVALLTEKKWVKLVPHPDNAAAKIIIITDQGHVILQQQQQVIYEVEHRLLQHLGEDKALLLKQLLSEKWVFDKLG